MTKVNVDATRRGYWVRYNFYDASIISKESDVAIYIVNDIIDVD